MDLATMVRKYRTLHKLSLGRFAELVGVSLNTVYNVERGKKLKKFTVKKLEDFFKDKLEEIRNVTIISDKSGVGPWVKGRELELLDVGTRKNLEKKLAKETGVDVALGK